jgi:oxygen-independent coproporphyrinogen-3 oxidase
VADYIDALNQGELPTAYEEILQDEQLRLEALMLGLRTAEGVPRAVVAAFPGSSEAMARLEAEGLATLTATHLRPTRAGLVIADSLPLMFIRGAM